jgi:hypothetical protein
MHRRAVLLGAASLVACHDEMLVQYSAPMSPPSGIFVPDPGITISGTFEDGQTVTLNMASGGFGTKPNGALPLYLFTLEYDMKPDPVYSRIQTAPPPDPQNIMQSVIVPPNAKGSCRTRACLGSSPGRGGLASPIIFTNGSGGGELVIGSPAASSDMYCFLKRYADHQIFFFTASFTASISGTVMTVTASTGGDIKVGMGLISSSIAVGTYITADTGGNHGVGTYSVLPSQTAASSVITVQSINCKNLRLWKSYTGVIAASTSDYWSIENANCSNNPFLGPGGTGSVSAQWYGSQHVPALFPAAQNVWYTDEHIWRESSIDLLDGRMDWYRNGIRGVDIKFASQFVANVCTRNSAYNAQYNTELIGGSLFFDEYSNEDPDPFGLGGAFDYKHFIYCDDSQKRIMVSDEAAISMTGATREVCICTSWSDTSVTCIIRRGALPMLSGHYLWAWTDLDTQIRLGRWL